MIIIIGSRKTEGQEEIKEACVCIGGFLQPIPFVQRHYSIIYESDDGFADRILLCTPKQKLLKENEVEEWIVKLKAIGLTSLEPVCSLIHEWHSGNDEIVYTFVLNTVVVFDHHYQHRLCCELHLLRIMDVLVTAYCYNN